MVGQEELVDSVVVDVTIYNPGGPHLGAFPGPLFGAFRHTFLFDILKRREKVLHKSGRHSIILVYQFRD